MLIEWLLRAVRLRENHFPQLFVSDCEKIVKIRLYQAKRSLKNGFVKS